jgi:hypothetical protein
MLKLLIIAGITVSLLSSCSSVPIVQREAWRDRSETIEEGCSDCRHVERRWESDKEDKPADPPEYP